METQDRDWEGQISGFYRVDTRYNLQPPANEPPRLSEAVRVYLESIGEVSGFCNPLFDMSDNTHFSPWTK